MFIYLSALLNGHQPTHIDDSPFEYIDPEAVVASAEL